MSKTFDELNDELDAAIESGDMEAMDSIEQQLAAFDSPSSAKDVAESDEDDGDADAPEEDDNGSSAVAEEAEEPEGVATKNGKGIIPYSELEKSRQETADLKAQLEQMQANPQTDPAIVAELERNQRLLALYQEQATKNDLAAPVLPEEFKLTAEMLADLDEYGQVGKVLGILAKQNEILMAGSKANGVSAAAAAQAAAPAAATEDPQAIVSADPDLSRWQRSELAWSEVQKADQYLKDRPEFAGKPLSARLEKINEMVRARLGEAR
jgi:hypothetical protein